MITILHIVDNNVAFFIKSLNSQIAEKSFIFPFQNVSRDELKNSFDVFGGQRGVDLSKLLANQRCFEFVEFCL